MSRVFISYRREDTQWQAREIHRTLTQVLPPEQVFMDVANIELGVDFVKVLEAAVAECDILLALIGPDWVDVTDLETGTRRLDNPNDLVRIEVRRALERGIRVVPVLCEDARLPDAKRLPDDLKGLVNRNAEFVQHRTVDTDVPRLIRKLGLDKGTERQEAKPASPALIPREARNQNVAPPKQSFAVRVGTGANDKTIQLATGESIKDADALPEMVLVPPGRFWMGSTPETIAALKKEYNVEGLESEQPPHEVTIPAPLLVGRHPVTFAEWDAGVAAGGMTRTPDDEGWGRGRRPVINVSWHDARAYCTWASRAAGKAYRLLSEAEWEYCCRAGTTTPFSFGETISTDQANYDGNHTFGPGRKGVYRQKTTEVGSFPANGFGLHDMHGNAWEWCEDAWADNYAGAPADGSARTNADKSVARVLRGGSWRYDPQVLRSAYRYRLLPHLPVNRVGFRLARTLL